MALVAWCIALVAWHILSEVSLPGTDDKSGCMAHDDRLMAYVAYMLTRSCRILYCRGALTLALATCAASLLLSLTVYYIQNIQAM